MKRQRSQLIIASALGIILCLGVGFLSSRVTMEAIPTWYLGLNKPFFSPPNWLFAPVWTVLYILMGLSVGRVWFYGRRHLWGKTALYHFGAQLIFNGLWSLVFGLSFSRRSVSAHLRTFRLCYPLLLSTVLELRKLKKLNDR